MLDFKGLQFLLTFALFAAPLTTRAQKMPPSLKKSMEEPIIYTGGLKPDSSLFDGGLPHAVGVHSFQALRANRAHPPEAGSARGWTYNHQPYLAYWNDQFYLQYLSGEFQEHTPPTRVLIMTSENGRDWSSPETVFPVYDLHEINTELGHLDAGTKAVMHQRMGFYVAPNGKLLTLAFYSYTLSPRHSPNAGQGLGRVVREVKKDGSYGPIYFIRYNRHAGFDESNTNFPFYKESKDQAFLDACESLLQNKLITLQWWEEDRAKDGFFVVDPGDAQGAAYFSQSMTSSAGAGKAFNFYHRPDGVVVGIWKNQWSALSKDEGKSWTPFTKNKSLNPTGAKVWGQKLDDGSYALVHNQTAGFRNRYPMVVMTSEDGHKYTDMYSVRGDIPELRYQGIHKGIGAQYFRGIIEGNGNPPGDELWVTYSVNKEDIWVSAIKVPVEGMVTENVEQDFESARTLHDLQYWNLHVPQWAPLSIRSDPGSGNRYLELKDEDPYDFSKIERVFPKSKMVEISFELMTLLNQPGHALEIEVQDQQSARPLRLRIDNDWLMFDRDKIEVFPVPYDVGRWNTVKLIIDVEKKSYSTFYNGGPAREHIPLAEEVSAVERIVFRTGPFRGCANAHLARYGPPSENGLTIEDLPASGEKTAPCIYWLDNVKIKKIR